MEIAETPAAAPLAVRRSDARVGGLRRSLSWLVGAQVTRLGVGFAVGTLVARALGVAEFGRLSTAMGIAALAAFFAELGLRQVLVKEMAQRPRLAPALMSSGFRLLSALGLAAVPLCAAVAWFTGAPGILGPTLMLSLALLFNGHQAVFSRWDARGEAWRAARFAMAAGLASNLAKVLCLLAGLGVMAITGAVALECALAASLVFAAAWRMGWLADLRVASMPVMRCLLARALPVFLAQGGTLLLLRLDQIMLNAMAGHEAAGIYGAATRLSELVFLLVPVVVAGFMPRVAAAARSDAAAYRRMVASLLQVLSVAGLAAPLLWWVGGGLIVRILYGREFAACGPVLFIHCVSSLAYLHGQVRAFVLVTEGRARDGAWAALAGAALNVLLNLWWIPSTGAQGAAWATAVSYYAVWFAGTWAMPGQRWLAIAQVKSLAAPFMGRGAWRAVLAGLRGR